VAVEMVWRDQLLQGDHPDRREDPGFAPHHAVALRRLGRT
jgi:hypothetical protein